MSHKLKIVRVYGWDGSDKGRRFLVDRLWPRGIRKDSLEPFVWAKSLAPSTRLRRWFGHKPEQFEEFKNLYWEELDENPEAKTFRDEIDKTLTDEDVLLLYAAKDPSCNHAVVLKAWLLDR